MDPLTLYALTGLLFAVALGGAFFVFASGSGEKAQKRFSAVARPQATGRATRDQADLNQQRRKNMQVMLKELEKQQAAQKKRPSLRRRLEMAGLTITPRTYWVICGILSLVASGFALATQQTPLVASLAGFVAGLGLPRWALSFLTARREKAFTREFANAIDIIVRSVKSGLPVNEALKVVASEIPDPVGAEFRTICEGQRVGVPLDQGLKRMYERMPTSEVNFFGIVMSIQQKSGGNLSEALGNLAGVLRDRKRLEGKIKAMSSEAKASAGIIGSLPPAVMALVYTSTPDYIALLFSSKIGNLMLAGCVVWMAVGVFVMKKMISFKT